MKKHEPLITSLGELRVNLEEPVVASRVDFSLPVVYFGTATILPTIPRV